MCGLCGVIGVEGNLAVEKMCQTMTHRGLDSQGTIQQAEFSFGHDRLSVIDTSFAGQQPMANRNNSIWIIYNGAVYNFKSLKIDLEKKGYNFKSNTDTEVILYLYQEYGKRCLDYLRGMFAFAIWDDNKKELFAARDRFGIKPFFYYFQGDVFIFASELKAVLASGFVKKEINLSALGNYFRYGSVQAPESMIKGVHQLMPAHYLTLRNKKLNIERYWNLDFASKISAEKSEKEYVFNIKTILDEAVKIRMISDVPLGVFLSGGIDSSVITGLMQKYSHKPVKTFSVGFQEKFYDERRFSQIIARKFNTDHKEILLKESDIVSQIPGIFNAMDQPSIDGFNTFIISKAVKAAGITVALSGLGGDELFAGYSLFKTLPRINQFLKISKFMPQAVKSKLSSFLLDSTKTKQQLKGILSLLDCNSLENLYFLKRSVNLPRDIDKILSYDSNSCFKNSNWRDAEYGMDQINKLSYLELNNYLLNTLLADTDRMSMANSLEVRVPYLDHLLVQEIFKIPGKLKIGNNYPKRLLIKATKGLLPNEIYKRPKKGFVFPFDVWFKNGLKEYCADKLSKENTKNIPFLNSNNICQIWKEFLSNSKQYNYSSVISLLSFINWHEKTFYE